MCFEYFKLGVRCSEQNGYSFPCPLPCKDDGKGSTIFHLSAEKNFASGSCCFYCCNNLWKAERKLQLRLGPA